MKRSLFITEDGSHSLHIPEMDEHYHSTHGAIQESRHVFIDAGLKSSEADTLTIFEVGFGTGLNALLTLHENQSLKKHIHYYSIEKYPLVKEEYSVLNYPLVLSKAFQHSFDQMHESPWNEPVQLHSNFTLTKIQADIKDLNFDNYPHFDLIYFDAFAPNKQKGIWTQTTFNHLYQHANARAILVTYCAQGQVRRDLQEAGFTVERIPGPPGKREMLRARKIIK